MASGRQAVHQTIEARGRAASAATAAIIAALGTDDGAQIIQSGPGTIHVVRTRRPTWARVLGIVGLLGERSDPLVADPQRFGDVRGVETLRRTRVGGRGVMLSFYESVTTR